MRLLVTGGAGFIGSNFVRMIANGAIDGISELRVLDKLTYAGNLENLREIDSGSFEFIKGDICDVDTVNRVSNHVDAIINFAAESHVDKSISNPNDFILSNVLGVQNLLNASVYNDVGRFVQVSTDEVYGSVSSGFSLEADPILPNSPYSASKASAELLVRSYHKTYGLDTLITRSSNNYGPYQFPEKLIPLFITNLIKDKKVPIYGSGKNVRDWIFVEENCSAINKVMRSGKAGEIYNIGGNQQFTNLEITNLILELMNKDRSFIEFVRDRKGHDERYALNNEKVAKEIGFVPKLQFRLGLEKTIDWYLRNEHWWRKLVV
jgi:dTDP-glucose 4,6-dehydratase